MKSALLGLIAVCSLLFVSCDNNQKNSTKNNRVVLSEEPTDFEHQEFYDSLPLKPRSVLATSNPRFRLVTIYKEKVSTPRSYLSSEDEKPQPWIDGDYFHHGRYYSDDSCNVLNGNFMPGISAVYGNKMYNVTIFDSTEASRRPMFERNVLVNTLYFPASRTDTINCEYVDRNYYMVSVYDEDSNRDSIIDRRDLRKLYAFDMDGSNKRSLLPSDYSVVKSTYDPTIDHMYVYAVRDLDHNGTRGDFETLHVFAIDLSNPQEGEQMY